MQSREDIDKYICIMQGDHDFNSGKHNKAINEYYLAIEIDPLFSIAYFKLGLVYSHMKHDDEALSCFNRAIELNPQHTESYLGRANINTKKGKINSAVHDYKIAVSLSPSAAIYYKLGVLYERIQGYSIQALYAYTHAITLDPHFYDAYANRASLHYHECNTKYSPFNLSSAIEDYQSAVDIRPTLAEAHYHLGTAYSHTANCFSKTTRNIYRAIECFSKAIALDPKYIDAYLMRARIYNLDLSSWHKASCDYESVLALEPDNWAAREYLPTVKSQLAIINCTTKIKIRPSAELYLMRGHAYKQTRCYKAAKKDYSQAIKLGINMADAYLARAEIYTDHYYTHDETNAINDYQSAYMIDPNCAEAYFKLGLIYKRQNELENALLLFNKTLELDPNNAGAYSNRGYVHKKLNKTLESLLDYIKADELIPSCHIADDHINNILKEYPNRRDLSELIINHANLKEKSFLMSQALRVDTVLGKKFRECPANRLFQINQALRLLREPYEAMTKDRVAVRRAARFISLGQRDNVSFFRWLPDEIAVMIAARVAPLKDLNEREADEIAYDHLCTPLMRGLRYKR